MIKEMRNKFIILNMIIISALMLSAFFIIYKITYNNTQNQNIQTLAYLATPPHQTNIQSTTIYNIYQMEESTVIVHMGHRYFSVEVDKSGNVVNINSFMDMPKEYYEEAVKLALNQQGDKAQIMLNGSKFIYTITQHVNVSVGYHDGTKTVEDPVEGNYTITFLDVTDSNLALVSLLRTFFYVGILMLFVIFIISVYFANRAIKPLLEAWEKQKQFVTDASHQLKTPLAIITANTEVVLSDKEKTVHSQQKWLHNIQDEAYKMGKLINSLLYLSKAEYIDKSLGVSSFDISQSAFKAILSIEAMAFENEVTIIQNIEPDVILKCDQDKIEQVIIILLDNAIKYTSKGGTIEVSLKKLKDKTMVSIINSCKGIQEEDISKVFDRFYRGNTLNKEQVSGYGLGLPIAKAIIEGYGGKIYAKSIQNESATFTFII